MNMLENVWHDIEVCIQTGYMSGNYTNKHLIKTNYLHMEQE